MEKFSVLMSVYDKEKPQYLEQALYSVLNQTLMPNEVLLVKDGKLNKELEEVINKVKKEYPNILNILAFSENRGLGLALNDGLKACKYDIVFRMDTDDISKNNRFEKQIKVFKDKDIAIVGTNIEEFDENMENSLSIKSVPETSLEISKYVKKRNPFNHMSVAYRKSIILEVGSYEDVRYFEDYYLWCKVLKKYKGYNIQECLIDVRAGKSMFKRRGGFSYVKNIISFEKKILKLGTINYFEFIINVIERTLIAIFPSDLRSFFYNTFLRKHID